MLGLFLHHVEVELPIRMEGSMSGGSKSVQAKSHWVDPEWR
jgi:hypothetical protein